MHDAIVIGGGPAGVSAAINLRRSGRTVLLLEQETFGGQIALSPRVENIPGIASISGTDYALRMFEQIIGLGVDFDLGKVTGLSKDGDIFKVSTNSASYQARTVIIAAGCEHRKLGLPKEDELVGHGVSYCATCDGAFFAGEDVALIGDANSALQYALALAGYCRKVHICALFDRFFADDILVRRVKETPNIDVRFDLALKAFLGEKELTGLRFQDTKTLETVIYDVKAVFIAIGQLPHNEAFAALVDLKDGYIMTDETMATKTPGLFAAGDCRYKSFRQVVTAESDGLIAALGAERYLFGLQ